MRPIQRSADRLYALRFKAFEMVLHFLQAFGGMALPLGDLARDRSGSRAR